MKHLAKFFFKVCFGSTLPDKYWWVCIWKNSSLCRGVSRERKRGISFGIAELYISSSASSLLSFIAFNTSLWDRVSFVALLSVHCMRGMWVGKRRILLSSPRPFLVLHWLRWTILWKLTITPSLEEASSL